MFVRACLSITQREENKAKRAKLLEEERETEIGREETKKVCSTSTYMHTHTFHPAAFNFSSRGKLGPCDRKVMHMVYTGHRFQILYSSV